MDDTDRETKKRWRGGRFPLPDPELDALFTALDDHLEQAACDHTIDFTRAWLTTRGHDVDRVSEWLRSTGGFCDCEVAMNSRRHWEERRREKYGRPGSH